MPFFEIQVALPGVYLIAPAIDCPDMVPQLAIVLAVPGVKILGIPEAEVSADIGYGIGPAVCLGKIQAGAQHIAAIGDKMMKYLYIVEGILAALVRNGAIIPEDFALP